MNRLRYSLAGRVLGLALAIMPAGKFRTTLRDFVLDWQEAIAFEARRQAESSALAKTF